MVKHLKKWLIWMKKKHLWNTVLDFWFKVDLSKQGLAMHLYHDKGTFTNSGIITVTKIYSSHLFQCLIVPETFLRLYPLRFENRGKKALRAFIKLVLRQQTELMLGTVRSTEHGFTPVISLNIVTITFLWPQYCKALVAGWVNILFGG